MDVARWGAGVGVGWRVVDECDYREVAGQVLVLELAEVAGVLIVGPGEGVVGLWQQGEDGPGIALVPGHAAAHVDDEDGNGGL